MVGRAHADQNSTFPYQAQGAIIPNTFLLFNKYHAPAILTRR